VRPVLDKPLVPRRASYRAAYASGSDFGDRALKREGYGIVRVDTAEQQAVLECWRWDTEPASGGEYPGFPVTVALDRA
jgi:hypothetical protein